MDGVVGSDIDHDEASYFSVVVGRNTINSWVKAGFLDELSRRSGAHVEIGKDVIKGCWAKGDL